MQLVPSLAMLDQQVLGHSSGHYFCWVPRQTPSGATYRPSGLWHVKASQPYPSRGYGRDWASSPQIQPSSIRYAIAGGILGQVSVGFPAVAGTGFDIAPAISVSDGPQGRSRGIRSWV